MRRTQRLFVFLITVPCHLAAEKSALPAASIARTRKVWEPIFSFRFWGEVQAAKVAESSRHSKREPASEAANSNLALAVFFFAVSCACGLGGELGVGGGGVGGRAGRPPAPTCRP